MKKITLLALILIFFIPSSLALQDWIVKKMVNFEYFGSDYTDTEYWMMIDEIHPVDAEYIVGSSMADSSLTWRVNPIGSSVEYAIPDDPAVQQEKQAERAFIFSFYRGTYIYAGDDKEDYNYWTWLESVGWREGPDMDKEEYEALVTEEIHLCNIVHKDTIFEDDTLNSMRVRWRCIDIEAMGSFVSTFHSTKFEDADDIDYGYWLMLVGLEEEYGKDYTLKLFVEDNLNGYMVLRDHVEDQTTPLVQAKVSLNPKGTVMKKLTLLALVLFLFASGSYGMGDWLTEQMEMYEYFGDDYTDSEYWEMIDALDAENAPYRLHQNHTYMGGLEARVNPLDSSDSSQPSTFKSVPLVNARDRYDCTSEDAIEGSFEGDDESLDEQYWQELLEIERSQGSDHALQLFIDDLENGYFLDNLIDK